MADPFVFPRLRTQLSLSYRVICSGVVDTERVQEPSLHRLWVVRPSSVPMASLRRSERPSGILLPTYVGSVGEWKTSPLGQLYAIPFPLGNVSCISCLSRSVHKGRPSLSVGTYKDSSANDNSKDSKLFTSASLDHRRRLAFMHHDTSCATPLLRPYHSVTSTRAGIEPADLGGVTFLAERIQPRLLYRIDIRPFFITAI